MEELKIKGNDCLRAGNIEEAIEFYTEAINLEPTAILFSNRSNAFLKLNKHYEAFRDANQAIMLNPSWSKGHFRKGEIQLTVGQFSEALQSYQTAQVLQQQAEGKPDLLITERMISSHQNLLQLRKKEKNLPWLSAGVGLIVAVVIIVADYTMTKSPAITHVLVQSLFVLVLSGIGGCIGSVWVWYCRHLTNARLQPTLQQQEQEQQEEKTTSNGSPPQETSPARQHSRYTKAQARQRYKKGKS